MISQSAARTTSRNGREPHSPSLRSSGPCSVGSRLKTIALCVAMAAGLSACGNSGADYRPLVDLQSPNSSPELQARYESDLASCQELARSHSYTNDNALTQTGAGAVIGTGLGALTDGLGGAVAGAIVGSAAGAVSSGFETWNKRESIVTKCLANRGHQVAG